MKCIKCTSCGSSVELNYEKLIGYCPYCGAQLYFDIDQVQDILKEREHTKQIELQEEGMTKRAQYVNETQNNETNANKQVVLWILGVWIGSLIFFAILSMMTLDCVNFSPYQLILILDLIVGIFVLKNAIKK